MNCSVKEAIKNRKSVRTFDGKPVTAEDVEILKNYVKTIKNPFGIPIEFKFLTAKEHGVSSAVIVGADLYLAAKVKRVEHYEIALGYSFEKACLFAVSCGLGTVMLAGSLSRAAFENAMNVGEDEALPVATPIGYPSKKHSLREIVMRASRCHSDRVSVEKALSSRDRYEKGDQSGRQKGFRRVVFLRLFR